MSVLTLQWILLIGSSVGLFFIAPRAKSVKDFFRGSKNEQAPGFWLLTSSLIISWLFAKSITNAANLGMAFGFVGGVAYAVYYLSFVTAGIIIYRMRTKGGFTSIHHFLRSKYGAGAVMIFSLLIGLRLWNEVWSNTMVIGTYFGEKGSWGYYLAILIFTGLTLAYTLKGGLRSSLLTDLIQMVLFAVLLFAIMGMVLPAQGGDVGAFVHTGEWTLEGGLNLAFVALLHVFSYPFHDPVMTDRGFISSPSVTLQSFLFAALIGSMSILVFSFVGIYAGMEGLSGQAPVEVSMLLGTGMMLMMNVIMVTSAASTLDSSFNSFSKLAIIDLSWVKTPSVKTGRWAIILIAILGSIPVFWGADILSATTISGTMVIGLSPVFLFWQGSFPTISLYLSLGVGIALGLALTFGFYPEELVFFKGKYGDLFSANLLGMITCLVVFLIPGFLNSSNSFVYEKHS